MPRFGNKGLSSVPNPQVVPQGPWGVPRAPDGTEWLAVVCLKYSKCRTAVFR